MMLVYLTLLVAGLPQALGANWTYTGEVKVGILHSLTGTMAISEITVVNAELMAIDEINNAGGLLGKKIVPVVADGQSNWGVFTQLAEQFTTPGSSMYVDVVFGCWTSASRKAVKPVFEKNSHMLFYPVQYEGQECSKNIFYTGATPNQQAEPAVEWLLRLKSTKFFLVGSDYVYPRTANAIVRAQLDALGGTVVGEMYLQLGEKSNATVGAIVQAIIQGLPQGGAIINHDNNHDNNNHDNNNHDNNNHDNNNHDNNKHDNNNHDNNNHDNMTITMTSMTKMIITNMTITISNNHDNDNNTNNNNNHDPKHSNDCSNDS